MSQISYYGIVNNKLNYILSKSKSLINQATAFNAKNKVNLFIIGEQKCGTSSLHKLLINTQQVLGISNKECQYFNTEKFENDTKYRNYHKMFEHSNLKHYDYLLDSTPDYLFSQTALENLYAYNPNAKIIICLRNPVKRFISAYNFYFSNILDNLETTNEHFFKYATFGREIYKYLKQNSYLSIEAFLHDELNNVSPICALERGNYCVHISRWMKKFDEKNFCVLFFENFLNADKIADEIALLESFLSLRLRGQFPKENVSFKKEKASNKVIEELQAYYSDKTDCLKYVIERDVPWIA